MSESMDTHDYKQLAVFFDVQDVYDISESILCFFELEEPEKVAVDDFIGLYKVGLVNPNDRLAAVDVILINSDTETASSSGCAVFRPEILASLEDSIMTDEFYQFCYHRVTPNGITILGDSLPFHLGTGCAYDDSDKSRSNDEDFVVVKSRKSSNREQLNLILREREELKKKLVETSAELDKMKERYSCLEATLSQLDSVVKTIQFELEQSTANSSDPMKFKNRDLNAEYMEFNIELRMVSSKIEALMQVYQANGGDGDTKVNEYLLKLEKEMASWETKFADFKSMHDTEANVSKTVCEKLRGDVGRLTELLSLCEEDKKTIVSKNEQITSLENECQDLRKKLEYGHTEREIQAMQVERTLLLNGELQQDLEKARSECLALYARANEERTAKAKLQTDFDEKSLEMDALQTKYLTNADAVKTLHEKVAEQIQEKKNLEDKLKALSAIEDENKSLKEQLQTVEEKLRNEMNARNELKALRRSYRSLLEESKNFVDLKRKASLCNELSSTLALLQTENSELRQANKHLQSLIYAQTKEVSALEKKLAEMKISNSEAALSTMQDLSGCETSPDLTKSKDVSADKVPASYLRKGCDRSNTSSSVSEINGVNEKPVIQCPFCDLAFPPDVGDMLVNIHIDSHLNSCCPVCNEPFPNSFSANSRNIHVESHFLDD